MAYDNKLKGALFENDRKEKDTHPDYRGSLETEDGTQYWVSAWIKQPQDQSKPPFLSLALTLKDGQQSSNTPRQQAPRSDASDFLARNRAKADAHKAPQAPRQPQKAQDFDSFDDDIPF